MHTNELQTAIDVFRVLETGDTALARATAAPTFRNREAAVAPPACSIPGPRGLLASSGWMRSAFDELRFPVIEAGFDAGTAWVRVRMQGIQNRPFVQFHDGKAARVLPPTARRVDFEQIHVLHVTEAGVADHEAVRDDLTMLQQLGAFPPTPGLVLGALVGKLTGAGRRAASAAEEAARSSAATY